MTFQSISFTDLLRQPVEEIKRAVLEQIRPYVEQVLRRVLEAQWHAWIVTWTRYNIRAFSNEHLAEMAGEVNAEVGRRAIAAGTLTAA